MEKRGVNRKINPSDGVTIRAINQSMEKENPECKSAKEDKKMCFTVFTLSKSEKKITNK